MIGPENTSLKDPRPASIELLVHRDRQADAAVIELPDRKVLLRAGQWSPWIKLDFRLSAPLDLPDSRVSGICRFFLQEVAPNFRLYVSPINIDPSHPAMRISEPDEFVREISGELGLFATTGFQEDHKALSNGVFNDEQFIAQAQGVLEERLRLLDYAMAHYDDGVLFFYFSSTDLQAHMLWWDSDEKHPDQVGRPGAKAASATSASLYREAGRRGGRDPRPLRRPRHGPRDERSRLRQFRPAVQPQFLAPRSGISRAA